ncbi:MULTISPECIES: hypothetical protein [unclassified Rathayibacter]|jgi:hypothetical protein|uniref:hypothetical protein n=1 Tax=unclassified Rathayibacter TaxID=2609250 RepID=UPI0015E22B0D|nr:MULTISPECIES: hypothetical protein [unclassified Rathayibacter]
MTTISTDAQSADLTALAGAHDTFATVDELGSDAATEAPATTPLCVGIIVGATLGAGC